MKSLSIGEVVPVSVQESLSSEEVISVSLMQSLRIVVVIPVSLQKFVSQRLALSFEKVLDALDRRR